ncbi:hypothetical protein AB0442_42525 [Kitasatospora sp. NPDC085895]|uniref:hypothetical protein n=1 Tax=Kitasatospora sp. NPDC085895 TaxID=3155057 RepID=UPI0034502D13
MQGAVGGVGVGTTARLRTGTAAVVWARAWKERSSSAADRDSAVVCQPQEHVAVHPARPVQSASRNAP